MSDTFNYALTLNQEGVHVLRSTVESFNLKQVSDKDIVSFYQKFSNNAAFDTGLLPLDGTGVLAIRAAGNHMQVTVQHKPGLYYVNWGAYEGDKSVKTYSLAQPYRIIIGDFVDGQLLGARMFYSPYPITHPDMLLYHVNLPNINCKGYRGNGVGWICLYLKEDWSNLPLNEKISRFIERCSGVETYNDANMSETDGPRFYKDHYQDQKDYDYLWSPDSWQQKSVDHGYEWTLDPNIWIPVKVYSIDQQGKHDSAGINLTLSGALLGNYQAYYTDKEIPKFYNVVSRQDLDLNHDQIAKFVKKSFSEASINYTYNHLSNPLKSSSESREKKSSDVLELPFPDQNSEEDEETTHCHCCGNDFVGDATFDVAGNAICTPCIESHFIYIESVGEYYSNEDENIYYDEETFSYYHVEYDTVIPCPSCDVIYCAHGNNASLSSYIYRYQINGSENDIHEYCYKCVENYAKKLSLDTIKCTCGKRSYIKDHLKYALSSPTVKSFIIPIIEFNNNIPQVNYESKTIISCDSCVDNSILFKQLCPCGNLVNTTSMNKCLTTTADVEGKKFDVVSACSGCIGSISIDPQTGVAIGSFSPENVDLWNASVKTGVVLNSPYVLPHKDESVMNSLF